MNEARTNQPPDDRAANYHAKFVKPVGFAKVRSRDNLNNMLVRFPKNKAELLPKRRPVVDWQASFPHFSHGIRAILAPDLLRKCVTDERFFAPPKSFENASWEHSTRPGKARANPRFQSVGADYFCTFGGAARTTRHGQTWAAGMSDSATAAGIRAK